MEITEIPEECKVIVDDLKKQGMKVLRSYYYKDLKVCIVDFIDPYTNKVLEKKEGIVPRGWYISSISYHLDDKTISMNINRIPPRDTFELYIPDECNEEGKCRIHIYYDPEMKKIGFDGKEFKKDKALNFIKYFFRIL